MTGRFFARDVKEAIIGVLGGSSSGFNTMLSTIDTERSDTTPTATSIIDHWGRNQYPFLMVDIDGAEVNYEDADISLNIANLPMDYTVLIGGYLKYADDNIHNWCENWIEAIERVLHNYNTANISWVTLKGEERAELYKDNNEIIKTFVVEFEARVN